ncbi:Hypothetical protein MCYN_0436 [Mycoplasmopsis cynos C142]|uniref:Uncharacterized protein n=1 Tax=Mycoplasmopsis cynos (strain C142) TaxID=1246955 RepID=L0RUL2_MYCC1|nr:Hypothetical protein MCYN_0436 [Mycoplasmopsis cynos C142]
MEIKNIYDKVGEVVIEKNKALPKVKIDLTTETTIRESVLSRFRTSLLILFKIVPTPKLFKSCGENSKILANTLFLIFIEKLVVILEIRNTCIKSEIQIIITTNKIKNPPYLKIIVCFWLLVKFWYSCFSSATKFMILWTYCGLKTSSAIWIAIKIIAININIRFPLRKLKIEILLVVFFIYTI